MQFIREGTTNEHISASRRWEGNATKGGTKRTLACKAHTLNWKDPLSIHSWYHLINIMDFFSTSRENVLLFTWRSEEIIPDLTTSVTPRERVSRISIRSFINSLLLLLLVTCISWTKAPTSGSAVSPMTSNNSCDVMHFIRFVTLTSWSKAPSSAFLSFFRRLALQCDISCLVWFVMTTTPSLMENPKQDFKAEQHESWWRSVPLCSCSPSLSLPPYSSSSSMHCTLKVKVTAMHSLFTRLLYSRSQAVPLLWRDRERGDTQHPLTYLYDSPSE